MSAYDPNELTVIAKGRRAELFRLDNGMALKLYLQATSRSVVERELRACRVAAERGLAVPAPGELVEIDGRIGFTCELVDGVDGMKRIYAGADVQEEAETLARLQSELHRLKGSGLPPVRKRLMDRVAEAPELDAATRRWLMEVLEKLPDGDALLHGDFHPGNLVFGSNRIVIVDWVDAACGAPEADVARTLVLGGCGANDHIPEQKLFMDHYIERYRSFAGRELANLDEWVLICAAARICEDTEDTPYLLHYLSEKRRVVS